MDLAWHQGCASSRTAIHSVGGPEVFDVFQASGLSRILLSTYGDQAMALVDME